MYLIIISILLSLKVSFSVEISRLVCEITYTTPDQKSMSYRKFYRFQVLKPLDVKTKFYNAEVRAVLSRTLLHVLLFFS